MFLSVDVSVPDRVDTIMLLFSFDYIKAQNQSADDKANINQRKIVAETFLEITKISCRNSTQINAALTN